MKYFLLFTSLLAISFLSLPASAQSKEVIGWIEWARLYPGNLKLKARIDTGAKTSSLNTTHHEIFQRSDKLWVRFSITNKKGKTVTLEKELYRFAKIKQKGTDPQKRPVIKLDICLCNMYKEIEVNLVDRSNFNYPMLIGRNFLVNHFIVDPSVIFTKNSKCKKNQSK
jgi:hypothetical protein